MKGIFHVLLMFVIASAGLCAKLVASDAYPCFNVVDYGAKGDGQTDDSNAFVKAWQDVCGATLGTPTFLIPKGKTFMLQPVLFQGPCKPGTVTIKLQGTIIAPESVDTWKLSNDDDRKTWVQFSDINGLVINGGGQVDGQGAAWWKHYDQRHRPTALRFRRCENLILSTLTHINSPKNHISIDTCSGASISNLHIIAPKESPNTDGIDIAKSSNIVIKNSAIETGDDCIAINSGSTFINITGISCGPGHGISVGSLGKNGDYATVEEVLVQNCTFSGTTNGARIKTWKGGCGYAKKITFEDIKLVGVSNPVIIDQQYHDHLSDVTHRNVRGTSTTIEDENQLNCDSKSEAVKVSDVTYRNVWGTSTIEDAIKLNCDNTVGCTDIILDNVHITSVVVAGEKKTAGEKKIYASCNNAKGTICYSCYPNVPCLSQERESAESGFGSNSSSKTNSWGESHDPLIATSRGISLYHIGLPIRKTKVFVALIFAMFYLNCNW